MSEKSLVKIEKAVAVIGDWKVLEIGHEVLLAEAARGKKPRVVDCGGLFDPYQVASQAKAAKLAPRAILERIEVARAFTAYQELALLRLVSRKAPGSLLLVINPISLLQDPDLPDADRGFLLNRVMKGLLWLAEHGHAVRMIQPDISHVELGARFQARLAACFPTMSAREGALQVLHDGKVGYAVQPGYRTGAEALGTFSARVA